MSTGGASQMLPIHGVKVLDVSDGICTTVGRILADLGADVVKIEPEEGARSRYSGVLGDGRSLSFAEANANKRSAVIELSTEAGTADFERLAAGANLVLLGGPDTRTLPYSISPTRLLELNPSLVVMELSAFGQTGPYRDWLGTNDTLGAISGLLAKSGLPGREPLLPPEHLVDAAASSHAAWTAMLALWKQHRTGIGEIIDFSALEGVAVSLDPGFGISGTARGAAVDLPHGRPDARHLYPIFRCADGWARICILSARQWSNMLEWMGMPAALSDPKYAVLGERYAAVDIINPVIAEFFATKTRDRIIEEGDKFGVPAAGLVHPSEVLTVAHFVERNTFVDVPVNESQVARMPSGYFDIDGSRVGYRVPAPEIGEHTGEVLSATAPPARTPSTLSHTVGRPFEGIRVLDLGVIVAGAETGRLFSDWGADVIKIENRKYPDGNRQSKGPNDVSQSFSWGHRNKRSLGLNLRTDRGREVFLDLVRESDVVLSNFKPGTLESLGIGVEVLRAANSRLIMADSSAFGSTGPWSKRMGYGPLVRASTGLSWLWSYPGDDDGFSDAITIYPDHVVSRFVAIAVISLLIRRENTGAGGTASVAQTDVLLTQMADRIMAESLHPGSTQIEGNNRGGDAPRGIFPCAGDDQWCVIDVRSDAQFRALAEAIGMEEWLERDELGSADGRLANRSVIDNFVRSFTRKRAPRDVVKLLQGSGVPSGFMQRASEFREDPQLVARGFLTLQDQPQFDGALTTQNGEAVFSSMGLPLFGAAPIHGEHTRTVATEVLGLSDSEIARLIDDGTLEVPPDGTL